MADETGTLHIPAPTATAPTWGQPQGFLSDLATETLIAEANAGKTLAQQIAYWWNWQRIAGSALRTLQMQEDYSRAVRFITGTPVEADRPVSEVSDDLKAICDAHNAAVSQRIKDADEAKAAKKKGAKGAAAGADK